MPLLKKFWIAGILVFTSAVSTIGAAGEYCWNEKVQYVILNGDSVYFTTDRSCPNWCTLHPAWSADQRKQAYAMLMTAKTTERALTLYWNEHSTSCGGVVPVGAYPTIMFIT